MNFLYAFLVCFFIVFCSEIGDKTQLLVLSFSSKSKTSSILLGVSLGTFFSHGLAILFGSKLGTLDDGNFKHILDIITYSSFLLIGITGFFIGENENENGSKNKFLNKISKLKLNYVLIVAICIVIGEIGDKTFLSSLGMGIQYPNYKLALILGSICGMACSNFFAIIFGKFLYKKFDNKVISFVSNLLFIIFGLIGFLTIKR
ncbi:MAG: TMEM165/GDT1 family protein [Clostridia bacterium]|nr:TMEM165/GDT1 family protein [Clostridia bacterium]